MIPLPTNRGIKPLIDLSGKYDSTLNKWVSNISDPGNPVQPITAAPSVGMDDVGRYWLYFGTGRFFDPDDKVDRHQQSFYGIKEPVSFGTERLMV